MSAIAARSWKINGMPKRILIMRFQAMGDTIITLPYIQSLKTQYPQLEIHFLTRKEVEAIPRAAKMFSRVIAVGGGRNARLQFLHCIFLLPWLWLQRYDVVIDLQNHKISRVIRMLLFAQSWSEFDRSSPVLAGERTKRTIEAIGIFKNIRISKVQLAEVPDVENKMKDSGWDGTSEIIVINPAGAFETRHWPLINYVQFARLWLQERPYTQFLVLGLPKISDKATYFSKELNGKVIDMTCNTDALEAFVILDKACLVISEDSGLMHMSWIQRVPTIAIFGSSNSYWSSPTGDRTFCFNSSDLACGNCLLEKCIHGDNRCLTRILPLAVKEKAVELLTHSI